MEQLLKKLYLEYKPWNCDHNSVELSAVSYFSATAHKGQFYGSKDYFTEHVYEVYKKTRDITNDPISCAVALLHDVIEDTPIKLEDINNEFGSEVALLTHLCTDPVGSSRKNRKKALYDLYDEYIFIDPVLTIRAATVKCIDRIKNQEYGISNNNISKMEMYVKEFPEFMRRIGHLVNNSYDGVIWNELFEQNKKMIERAVIYK